MRTVYTPPSKSKPYDDRIRGDGLLQYKYRGDDPKHHENRALRAAFELDLPLIWFVGVASAVYERAAPCGFAKIIPTSWNSSWSYRNKVATSSAEMRGRPRTTGHALDRMPLAIA